MRSVSSATWARVDPGQAAPVPGDGTLAGALAVEETAVDRGAGAAERNEGHGEMGIFDGQPERSPHLVAVERTMARPAHPACALQRPLARLGILTQHDGAGPVAAEAGAPRPVVFDAGEALEAKSLVRKPHRTVGIAFTGCDRVSHAGDKDVAHLDLADQALRRAVRQNDIDDRERHAAVANPQLHFLLAGAVHLPGRTLAVIEAPGATVIGRQGSRQHDADAMVTRRQIDFAFAVAIAEFQEPAGAVHAQTLDRIACPAAAVGLARQAPLRREHAVAARCGDVTLEVGLVAEQPEPVLDLPLDPQHARAFDLGVGSLPPPGRKQHWDQANETQIAHGIRQQETKDGSPKERPWSDPRER